MPSKKLPTAANLVRLVVSLWAITSTNAAVSQQISQYNCGALSDSFAFNIVIDSDTGAINDNGWVFIDGDTWDQCIEHVTWGPQKISWGHSCSDGTTLVDTLEFPSGLYRHHARGPYVRSDSLANCRPVPKGVAASTLGWLQRIFVH